MKITKKHIAAVIKRGNWILRRSNNGKSHGGFAWQPVGEWTIAPDWDPRAKCGGGLHGNGSKTDSENCFWAKGNRLEFCEIGDKFVAVEGPNGKIKCDRARILLINELPADLRVGGWLDLSGTGITKLPVDLHVGGSLDLRDTKITTLPANLRVGGYLDLSGTGIAKLPADLRVGRWLDLHNTKITALPADLHVGGSLYLRDTGITALPAGLHVGKDLYLRGTGITALPADLHVGGTIYK
jgi:hypothetical protein